MTTFKNLTLTAVVAVGFLSLGGCSNMSQRDQDRAVGAGVGAVAGSVLTGGSAIGTIGGAAVGGVVGNEVNKGR